MDFSFSEEQQMLREQAHGFLAERVPAERVVELAESDTPFDETLWKEMAGLGWTGLSIPEENGGSAMGFLDEAVLFEELGYALYPGPYFSTIALALPALQDADALSAVAAGETSVTLATAEPGSNAPLTDLEGLGTKASGSGHEWTLDGVKELVPDAGIAGRAVVTALADDGPGLWIVDLAGEGVSVDSAQTMDTTRRLGTLSLSGGRGYRLADSASAASILESIRLRALSAAALEAVGVAQKALDLAIDYVKERKQFDKPIGTYQAVSHQVADTYVEVELARSLAYWAAWTVAENDDHASSAVPAAKAAATEAAVTACERSIQVHGGIGFTWEHVLHRYYKRAQWLDSFGGFGTHQRESVANSILG